MVPFGIDREKLFLQIERLKEHVGKIKEIKEKKGEKEILISAIERNLQLAVEDCLNIGNHIISGLSLKRPDTYKEIFKNLKKENIISEEIEKEMIKLTGLRNRLVHLYWEVNEEEVLSACENLNIFEKFVKEVFDFLKSKGYI
jgi:uncharacterized protein YutE (UPF0331/DUF86 family)